MKQTLSLTFALFLYCSSSTQIISIRPPEPAADHVRQIDKTRENKGEIRVGGWGWSETGGYFLFSLLRISTVDLGFSHQNLNILLINLLNETALIPLLWLRGLFEKSNLLWSFETRELDALWKHIVTFRSQNFLSSPKSLNCAPKNG